MKSGGETRLNEKKFHIRAMTFDLWETLLFEEDGANSRRMSARLRSLSQALHKLGIEISSERLDLALKQVISSLLEVWNTDRDVSHLDQLRLLVRFASNGSVDLKDEWIQDLSSAYTSPVFEVPPYMNPDARGVLRWLKDRDICVGLICNTGLTPGATLRRFLEEKRVLKYFDLTLFSDEVGVRKPDPRIFQLAVQKLRIEPDKIVHVGDNLKSDVWGAQNAGFKAMLFSGEAGRDRTAESDPSSLVSLSRDLGGLNRKRIVPEDTISSLALVTSLVRRRKVNR
jgi:putative hydrolase of the HAD superfamily